MNYLDHSNRKVLIFGLVVFGLGASVIATLPVKRSLPAGYLSLDNGSSVLYTTARAMLYGLESSQPGEIETESGKEASAVPVLLYHGLVSKLDRFSMTPETFKDQMFALKQAGWKSITLEEFYAFQKGLMTLPAKSFLLTFDDGRTDSYLGADPVLAATGFKAVMFVATKDSLEGADEVHSYYLHLPELKMMLNSGRWEVGSHAIQDTGGDSGGEVVVDSGGRQGNFLSNKMWLPEVGRLENEDEYETRVRRELEKSKTDLENDLGITVNAFAYPFSDYGQQTLNNPSAEEAIKKNILANYTMAFNQVGIRDGVFTSNSPNTESNHLRRVEVPTLWSGQDLVNFLDATSGKDLPYEKSFQDVKGWKTNWGKLDPLSSVLGATASTTGAFTFLDGSENWTDYDYTLNGEWLKGETVSLIARLEDTRNFVDCTFSPENVEIQKVTNGVSQTLLKAKSVVPLSEAKVSLGILVEGETVKCYVGDRAAAYANMGEVGNGRGGIGLRVWDKALNNAGFAIDSLQVTRVQP